MPISADPTKIFELVLESDLQKPEAIRPRFKFRYLTSLEWRRCAEFQEQIEQVERPTEIVDGVFKFVKLGLVGWDHMITAGGIEGVAPGAAIPYDPEKLIEILTIFEAQELLAKLLGSSPNAGPTIEDKKKLELQPVVDTVRSAPPAAEG